MNYSTKIKDFYLANVISQSNSLARCNKVKKIMNDNWQSIGTFERFSQTMKIIFEMKSGIFNKKFFSMYNWKVTLLCYLTCIYPSQKTINQVFENFVKDYLPNENDANNLSKEDNLFALIKLYCFVESSSILKVKEYKSIDCNIIPLLNDIARTKSFNNNNANNADNHLQFITLHIIQNTIWDSGFECSSKDNEMHLR